MLLIPDGHAYPRSRPLGIALEAYRWNARVLSGLPAEPVRLRECSAAYRTGRSNGPGDG